MKIINHTSFDIVDDENIYDFIKYYGIVTVNEENMLELKLNFDDLPYESQLALIRYEDEEYEQTLFDTSFDKIDKGSLILLLKSTTNSDLYDAKLTLEQDVNDLAIELYRESCQDLINYLCAKISEEEQKSLKHG